MVDLGLAGLLGIFLLVTALDEVTPTPDHDVPLPVAALAAMIGHPESHWYFRLDQWRADARTAVAAVRFLLEIDPQGAPGAPLPIS